MSPRLRSTAALVVSMATCLLVGVAVGFRTLDEATIQAYLDRDQPYDCAGAIRVERGHDVVVIT